jgi:hypothetical protein
VTSTPANGGYSQDLTVVAYGGVTGGGASVAGSGANGVPSLKLTTTASTSLVFAVGNDWDNASACAVGDDYWSQYTNTPTGAAGTVVNVSDSAPTTDHWSMAAVELLGDRG